MESLQRIGTRVPLRARRLRSYHSLPSEGLFFPRGPESGPRRIRPQQTQPIHNRCKDRISRPAARGSGRDDVGRAFGRIGDLDDTSHANQEWDSTSRAVEPPQAKFCRSFGPTGQGMSRARTNARSWYLSSLASAERPLAAGRKRSQRSKPHPVFPAGGCTSRTTLNGVAKSLSLQLKYWNSLRRASPTAEFEKSLFSKRQLHYCLICQRSTDTSEELYA